MGNFGKLNSAIRSKKQLALKIKKDMHLVNKLSAYLFYDMEEYVSLLFTNKNKIWIQ